jgi:hypothetical protein
MLEKNTPPLHAPASAVMLEKNTPPLHAPASAAMLENNFPPLQNLLFIIPSERSNAGRKSPSFSSLIAALPKDNLTNIINFVLQSCDPVILGIKYNYLLD